jgi:hypothetical protein
MSYEEQDTCQARLLAAEPLTIWKSWTRRVIIQHVRVTLSKRVHLSSWHNIHSLNPKP